MNPFAKKAPAEAEVATLVREAVADNAKADSYIDGPHPTVVEPDEIESSPDDSVNDTEDRVTGYAKLSRLIDDDFPFDPSQLDAIEGMSQEPYACLTGAAGTGKTTTTKKLVDTLLESTAINSVDMETYWKKGTPTDADDDYEVVEKWVPSIAMCAFTGRATQMIKKNFPRDWHGNIMTIHRMLGFVPEFYEDWDDENGGMKKKMRFVPTYNADFKLPWDTIVIDEAGMLGIELWEQLFAALKDGCRIYMIGDINQLPPVHGKSVFGFAMSNWPAWELTKVHRQQGVNNPIVDNAWRILNGYRPQSEGRFQMIELKGDAAMASRKVQGIANKLKEMELYDPIRDSIITPINGEEGSRGFQLGQLPLNRAFALQFNPQSEHPRYIIDGGRERKQFAVGDKVMATKNDWETGITNGMTGVITSIAENMGYAGDRRLFGTVEAVNAYLAESPDEALVSDFTLEDLESSMEAIDDGKEKGREKRDRGPASHVVTVRFGDADHGMEIPFGSLSEVGSLMTAYVVTCHKMQGGEAPVILVICHGAHRSMLYREWLYTAVTRASEKCILLYSEDALKTALNKQKMPGSTLKQKVIAFNEAQESTFGARVPLLQHSHSTRNRIMDRKDVAVVTPAHLTTEADKKGGLAQLLKAKAQPKAEPEVTKRVIHEVHIKTTVVHENRPTPAPIKPRKEFVDGGDLTPHAKEEQRVEATALPAPALALPSPTPQLVPQWGAVFAMKRIEQERENATRLLSYQPAPQPEIKKPFNPFAKKGV